MFHKIFTKKVYISNVIIFKSEKVFSKMILWKQAKIIPKGVRSTKCPVATWRKKNTKYKTLHIRNYIFAHNFRAKSK
jgi:hypothetical protein